MPWQMVTPATDEPLPLELVRLHCRVDTEADDALLAEVYLPTAREYLENFTRYQFLTATLRYVGDCFPRCDTVWLPRPPLQSVTTIQYYDEANALQTWDAANYYVDTVSSPGRLVLAPTVSWPGTFERPNAVLITYVAGWTAPGLVPRALTAALLLLVGHLYENREETVEKALSKIPMGICTLAGMHRLEEIW